MKFYSLEYWPVHVICAGMIAAAVIDWWKFKVPNKLTFPLVFTGWALGLANNFGLGACEDGVSAGIGSALVGTLVGLGLMLPIYIIGGMGAGDVKLLAGVGAWVWGTVTLYAFCASAVIGGLIAVAMVLYRKAWEKHRDQFWMIWNEMVTIRDAEQLSVIAAERKSSMLLLPYGIPIALGTIAYFAWNGMLL